MEASSVFNATAEATTCTLSVVEPTVSWKSTRALCCNSHRDTGLLHRLKARRFHRYPILAGLDQRERIVAGGRGRRDPALARRHTQQCHLGIGDYPAAGIQHRPQNLSGRGLGSGEGRGQNHAKKQHYQARKRHGVPPFPVLWISGVQPDAPHSAQTPTLLWESIKEMQLPLSQTCQ